MNIPLIKTCPIHNQVHVGDPLRCLVCEPDQRKAELLRRKIPVKDIDSLTDEDGEIFERAMELKYARLFAQNN